MNIINQITRDLIIPFDHNPKIKNWKPPKGVYLSTFADFKYDEQDRIILYFRIHSIQDSVYEYWVRHVYRPTDMSILASHLKNWLGEQEFRQMIEEGSISLEKYLEKEALVDIRLNRNPKYKEALRVIANIYPADPTLQEQVGDAKFDI